MKWFACMNGEGINLKRVDYFSVYEDEKGFFVIANFNNGAIRLDKFSTEDEAKKLIADLVETLNLVG